ncbi:hypothetical protein Taro_047207 [Colocasia esculenta]|uniref:Uncharacterized protein n=1 Tax=Colocasia esculenta TaxID=4460 RepID=A0A843X0D8_COLES|nr:hypothetical protein [Colocasia esculenta]
MARPSPAGGRGPIERRHDVSRAASRIRVQFLHSGTSGTQKLPPSASQPVRTKAPPSEQGLLGLRRKPLRDGQYFLASGNWQQAVPPGTKYRTAGVRPQLGQAAVLRVLGVSVAALSRPSRGWRQELG